MAPPTFYDPQSLDEQPVPLPNAVLIQIRSDIVLQPPLSRRGTGPGIIIFLPDSAHLVLADQSAPKSLDPDPITKWAEEGFAVVAITGTSSDEVSSAAKALKEALEALQALEQVDMKQKFAVIGEYQTDVSLKLLFISSSISLRSESSVRCLRGCCQGTSHHSFCGLRVISYSNVFDRPDYAALDYRCT
jgi:flavin-binding protein dodecin